MRVFLFDKNKYIFNRARYFLSLVFTSSVIPNNLFNLVIESDYFFELFNNIAVRCICIYSMEATKLLQGAMVI